MDSLTSGAGRAYPPVGGLDVSIWIYPISIGGSPCSLPMIWRIRWMASLHVCSRCVGIWMSMVLELGSPSMQSLRGFVCMLASQGVRWFIWWSIIVTWSLDVIVEPCTFTNLCPRRIRLPSLPRASPPSRSKSSVPAPSPIWMGPVLSASENR